jgi:hypothetical protein
VVQYSLEFAVLHAVDIIPNVSSHLLSNIQFCHTQNELNQLRRLRNVALHVSQAIMAD